MTTTENPSPTPPEAAPAAARSGVGFRSERGPVLLAVMLSTALVALDATIIATAVPSIVRDLGGFSQFPWLFSIYLLTQAVTTPIYGKLADVVGRRPVLFFGIGVFLLGSVLCGAAWSMPVLIIARAVQGIGAGAVLPVTITIVGDLYSVEERARVQGYVASVWGGAAVLGPTLGGLFSEYLDWRWIFYVNLPIGALAVWMLARSLHEKVEHRRHQIDVAGTLLLTVGFSLVILGLLEGGVAWAWTSPISIAVFVVGFARDRGLRTRRAGGARAGAAAVGVQPPHPAQRQPRLHRHRSRPDRTHLLRAHLRPGRAGDRGPGGRVRRGRDDDRVADRGRALRPALPADRVPADRVDRQRRSPWPAASWSPSSVRRHR